ncbi:hypothetical protein NIES267_45540 [Calothrix parasitica NIES-267]|uniref:Knr4/Smi1-like domain-containing protein n=1 Tax=Calothrix parasitica NIES-267 TaxID=1973488 RepID=A0A1Z4LUY3_9CYAN|nr:hypothetical protein NIES267_45540 [Calothrix parasitica NIES-267]
MDLTEKLEKLGINSCREEKFSPLSEKEIKRIEIKLGTVFPEDYRQFLATYGESDFEEYAECSTDNGGISPGTFFGKNIEHAISEHKERLPVLMIPINEDAANNLICLSLRKDDFGAIYFQSHSIGWDESGDIENSKLESCFRFADSFSNFICRLVIQ